MKPPPGDKLDQMIDPQDTRTLIALGIEVASQSRGFRTATRELT